MKGGGVVGWFGGVVSTGLGKLRWWVWWHLPCLCRILGWGVWGWSEVVVYICLNSVERVGLFGWEGGMEDDMGRAPS